MLIICGGWYSLTQPMVINHHHHQTYIADSWLKKTNKQTKKNKKTDTKKTNQCIAKNTIIPVSPQLGLITCSSNDKPTII